jgi:UDP-glucose 4-epimerase
MATPRRALVTGAAGFIGACLARRLLREGHEVTLLVRPFSDTWRIDPLREHCRVLEADLADPDAIGRVTPGLEPDWVFNLAAHGAYSWQTDMPRMMAVNLGGTFNLLQACRDGGFEAFVNAGSSSEYGYKDHPPTESEALAPNSEYAVTKAAATHLCSLLALRDGLHVTTLRLYSAFGPFEDHRRLVPTLISNGLRGRLPPLVDPDISRDFVYVDDVAEAFLLAASRPAPGSDGVYNVGSGVQISIRQAVEITRRILGVSVAPEWDSYEERAWDTRVWVADPSKIQRELGWRAQVPFDEGFARTVEWVKTERLAARIYGIDPARSDSSAGSDP